MAGSSRTVQDPPARHAPITHEPSLSDYGHGLGAPTSGAAPAIAGLQKERNTGTIDWMIIDASGTPAQTLEHCRTGITSDAAQGR